MNMGQEYDSINIIRKANAAMEIDYRPGLDFKTIGIAGKAGSGKDTAAEIIKKLLWDHCGEAWDIDSFGKPILQMFNAMMGIEPLNCPLPRNQKEQPHPALSGMTPRKWMQLAGTEFMRDMVAQNIWINLLQARNAYGTGVIIPDVRFDNEGEFCDVVIKIDRPTEADVEAHSSESGIDDLFIDLTVINDGSLEDFEREIREAIGSLGYLGLEPSI